MVITGRLMIFLSLIMVIFFGCKKEKPTLSDIQSTKPTNQVKVDPETKQEDIDRKKQLLAITTFSGHLKLVLENQDLKGIANICDFDHGLYIDEYKCSRDFIFNSIDDGPALNFPVWGVSDFAENDPNINKSKVKAKLFLWGPEGYFTKLAGTGLNLIYSKILYAPDHPTLMNTWKKEIDLIRKEKARWFVWDDTTEFRLVNCTNPDIIISFTGKFDSLKLVELSTIYGIEP